MAKQTDTDRRFVTLALLGSMMAKSRGIVVADEDSEKSRVIHTQRVRAAMLKSRGPTNKEFARDNTEFKEACLKAAQKECRDFEMPECHGSSCCLSCNKSKVLDTPRQASKFRMKKGLAWAAHLRLVQGA